MINFLSTSGIFSSILFLIPLSLGYYLIFIRNEDLSPLSKEEN